MTPEEYKRIKEAEKEHLRKLKQLKNAVRQFERQKAVNQALTDMVTGSKDTLDVHQEMVDKLAIETAQQEARLEIALENQALAEEADGTSSASTDQASEDALLEIRAKSLLQQIKMQMGATTPSEQEAPPPASEPSASETPSKRAEDAPPPADRPEKTIGRMR